MVMITLGQKKMLVTNVSRFSPFYCVSFLPDTSMYSISSFQFIVAIQTQNGNETVSIILQICKFLKSLETPKNITKSQQS